MKINEYQEESRKTKIYPDEAQITYPLLGLVGEVGEFANKLKKVLRDHGAKNLSIHTIPKNVYEQLQEEMGDIMWYIANLSTDLKFDLDVIAANNLKKLFSRKERGKLGGSGDSR